ncbi:MAG: GHMP kinase [Actinobacteria bacterium]|nr:GHMP kinase [Actinomycetota bacterium]
MAGEPVRARAPLRISFVGGGTDFPHYFGEHGGAVLSATIDHFVTVSVTPRTDRQVRVHSLDLGHLVEYRLDEGPTYDGVMDLAKAAIERMGVRGGIDVSIGSEAPPGSGLGGSSALVVAVVAALAALVDVPLAADELARLAHTIEREDLGIAGGWQDQYAASFGGMNLMEFSAGGVRVTPVEVGAEIVGRLEERLLLCYTGLVRSNVGLIDTQIRLYEEGREETILGMKHLQEMAYSMRGALAAGDLDALGSMLGEAFENKKRMNPHVAESTPIEAMLSAARGAGAAGGKICGAGGGGYVLVYCSPERRPEVRSELERLGGRVAPFRFHPEGVRARRGAAAWAPRIW